MRGPAPVYPHSLLWRAGNPHPAVGALRSWVDGAAPGRDADTWAPRWA